MNYRGPESPSQLVDRKRHLRWIGNGLYPKRPDARLKAAYDKRAIERKQPTEPIATSEGSTLAAVIILLDELRAAEQAHPETPPLSPDQLQEVQEAVDEAVATQNPEPIFRLPAVLQRIVFSLLIAVVAATSFSGVAEAQAKINIEQAATTSKQESADTTNSEPETPPLDVLSMGQTMGPVTLFETPKITASNLGKLKKDTAVAILNTSEDAGMTTQIAYLDEDGKLQTAYVVTGLISEEISPEAQESCDALEAALAQETEPIRKVLTFTSQQSTFENPEDLSSKTGEFLPAGAYETTNVIEKNGFVWASILDENGNEVWLIVEIPGKNVQNGTLGRELAEDEQLSPEDKNVFPIIVIPNSDLNVRSEASTDAKVVGKVTKGTEYTATEVSTGSEVWARITLPDDTRGWVAIFVGGKDFSTLKNKNLISPENREINDTDAFFEEIAVKELQKIDDQVVHAEFMNKEGERGYSELLVFDKDGEVIYQTTFNQILGATCLYKVDSQGRVDLTNPIAQKVDGQWKPLEAQTSEATENSAVDQETAVRELYPDELFETIENDGGSTAYNEELGLFTAEIDGHTFVLIPEAAAGSAEGDAQKAKFTYDNPEKQTKTNSDGTVSLTVLTQERNPMAKTVEFNPKLLADQKLFDEWLDALMAYLPDDIRPKAGEPPLNIVLGTTNEAKEDYEQRPSEEVVTGFDGAFEVRVRKTGNTLLIVIFGPFNTRKENYVMDADGNPYDASRIDYAKYGLNSFEEAFRAAGLKGWGIESDPSLDAKLQALQQKIQGMGIEITFEIKELLEQYVNGTYVPSN